MVLADVSQACCDTANSGVMRVTRCLYRHLQPLTDLVFAVWDLDHNAYTVPYRCEYEFIGSFSGPRTDGLPRSLDGQRIDLLSAMTDRQVRPDWILLTEIVPESRGKLVRHLARAHGIRIGAIFYDAIPVLYPEFVTDAAVRKNHSKYMRGLADCDVVIPISRFSQRCLEEFWESEGVAGTATETVLLPDEFEGAPRRTEPKELAPDEPVEILCVATLEPRKNHVVLLAALQQLDHLKPGLDWRLTLVGTGAYHGAETVRLAVRAAAFADPRIRWLGIVDDHTLHRLYAESTFTVYASCVEGFGMPIVESLWHGTAVVCHEAGVMRELATDGGCLVTDVGDRGALARALAQLATDKPLYDELAAQAALRPVRSWQQYARDVVDVLDRHAGS